MASVPPSARRSVLHRHPRLATAGLSIGSVLLTLLALEGLARATRQEGPGKEAAFVSSMICDTRKQPFSNWLTHIQFGLDLLVVKCYHGVRGKNHGSAG